MRCRTLALLVAVLAVLGGCGDDAASTATEGPGSTSATSTTPVDASDGEGEVVRSLWATMRIGPNGGGQVTEVIEYDFGAQERHGIYREVPHLDPAAPITVSSSTAPDDLLVTPTDDGTKIRIGDPERTITGVHTYTIRFPLDVMEGRQLSWDAVGTQWEVPINDVELHLTGTTAWSGGDCVTAQAGEDNPCEIHEPEPGHLAVRLDELRAGESVTLGAIADDRLDNPPAPPSPPRG